jgi:hypothetical protein
MSSFRKFGGTNFATHQNIAKSTTLHSNQYQCTSTNGLKNTKNTLLTHRDMVGNSILNIGSIYFQDGSTMSSTNGSQGPQGNQGFPGYSGTTGIGYQGSQGSQGPTGYSGNIGNQGSTGPQGFQGYTGYQGSTGNQGATGYQGATGNQGPNGYSGNNCDETMPQMYSSSSGFYNGAFMECGRTTTNDSGVATITLNTINKIGSIMASVQSNDDEHAIIVLRSVSSTSFTIKTIKEDHSAISRNVYYNVIGKNT